MRFYRKAGLGLASAAVLAAAIPGVRHWEGRSLRAYQDIVGVWTICDGVTDGVKPGDLATPADCDARLMQELRSHAEGLSACIDDPLVAQIPRQTAAALLSWTYNVGVGAACGSTLVRYLNAGNWARVCPELSRWTRAGGRVIRGLVNRRAAERADCEAGLHEAGLI
ncbi:lysozyme [Thalassobius vesicularis]|uniref:Lysozyme n=1 Tax=Thalassobius vesicularis TaxID=1294297 RepID=A0A4S3M4J6_9RHOB|nr:lysozyme [Thalassobius vesicularis]THD71268.1 lysozyme [Thalassobius vesicularis]